MLLKNYNPVRINLLTNHNTKIAIMSERVRYSDEELEEFRVIINEKLELAKRDYEKIMRAIRNEDENGVIDA